MTHHCPLSLRQEDLDVGVAGGCRLGGVGGVAGGGGGQGVAGGEDRVRRGLGWSKWQVY